MIDEKYFNRIFNYNENETSLVESLLNEASMKQKYLDDYITKEILKDEFSLLNATLKTIQKRSIDWLNALVNEYKGSNMIFFKPTHVRTNKRPFYYEDRTTNEKLLRLMYYVLVTCRSDYKVRLGWFEDSPKYFKWYLNELYLEKGGIKYFKYSLAVMKLKS